MTDNARPRTTRQRSNGRAGRNTKDSVLKVRIRGRDDAPLSMLDLKQGLYELARKLESYGDYRARRATLYLNIVDDKGQDVRLNKSGELNIFPYPCAADEHGVP